MLEVLFSFLYIAVLCFLIGFGGCKLLTALFPEYRTCQPVTILVTGIVLITVYTEYFSMITKIGLLCQLLVLLAAIFIACLYRKELWSLLKQYIAILLSWEGFFYLCLALLVAFFCSRGPIHTDTNIYHAQAIRIYEEYGLIKGLGNLQLHFGYNSAYLAFASFFSMHFLLPKPWHTTTGFIELLFMLYACRGLKNFPQHTSHLSDFGRIAILIYALVNLTGSISPATDYATMFLLLYTATSWMELIEQKGSVSQYALLSVLIVYIATLKLSASSMVLLVICPAVSLLKKKQWKSIFKYLLLGILILMPYLMRNVLLTGWLIYPFESIDLFNVSWKVPLDYLLVDSYQIKVWGRCLYDVSKIDLPLREWLPIWWDSQERYAKMLIYANVLGLFLGIINYIYKKSKRIAVSLPLALLSVSLLFSLGVWFFLTPFIRYGLSFLLLLPLIPIGSYLGYTKKGLGSILTGTLVLGIVLCLSPYIDHYVTEDGVFAKQQLTAPYYLLQKDYDRADTESTVINGNTVYYSKDGIVNDYYHTPNTCYQFMLDRTTLLGDKLTDGFCAK